MANPCLFDYCAGPEFKVELVVGYHWLYEVFF